MVEQRYVWVNLHVLVIQQEEASEVANKTEQGLKPISVEDDIGLKEMYGSYFPQDCKEEGRRWVKIMKCINEKDKIIWSLFSQTGVYFHF